MDGQPIEFRQVVQDITEVYTFLCRSECGLRESDIDLDLLDRVMGLR
jgi:hypothetical protein